MCERKNRIRSQNRIMKKIKKTNQKNQKIDMPIKKQENKKNQTKNKYSNGIKKINEKFRISPTPIIESTLMTPKEKEIMLMIFSYSLGGPVSLSNQHIAY